MKKICILAYWYPPLQAVGSLRAQSFVNYAKQNDYEAFVVSVEPNGLCTPSAPEVELSEKVYRILGFDLNFLIRNTIRKMLGKKKESDQYQSKVKSSNLLVTKLKQAFYYIYRKILCFPDTHFYWYFRGRKKLREIIENEKPEYLLTTAFPVTSFYLGRYIKKEFPEIKWIADYRDVWSQHQWYERPWPLNALERKCERRVLKSSDLIITTSEEFREKLTKLHSDSVSLVYNGFDEDVNENEKSLSKFVISYTGVLYEQQRPEIFFEAVKNLIDKGRIKEEHLIIDFYGKMPDYLMGLVSSFGLNGVTTLHGLIPRDEVINKQRTSNILLLIRWDKGPLHVKVFEYLSARIPILALVNQESEIADLVSKTSSGIVCQDILQIENFIFEEYTKWLESGKNRLVEKSSEVLFYSRENQAKELYSLLSGIE